DSNDGRPRFIIGGDGGLDLSKKLATLIRKDNKDITFFFGSFNCEQWRRIFWSEHLYGTTKLTCRLNRLLPYVHYMLL
ncbi:unnamed protein product, partial [Rotaria magnacalcarata]